MTVLQAMKERIELAESMVRHVPVTAFNIRLAADGAMADLMVAGELKKDQPYTYRQFFVASKFRRLTMN